MALPNSSTGSTYGALGKIDFQGLPPADATYSWSNPLLAPGICDIANLTNTAPRGLAQLTLASSTGSLVLNNWFAVWMNATTTAPTLARSGTGVFTITFPTSVSDQYSQSVGNPSAIPVNFIMPIGCVVSGGPAFVNASVSANVITINTYSIAGSANDLDGYVVSVCVR